MNYKDVNFFSNSIYITNEHASIVNKEINGYFKELNNYIKAKNYNLSLFIAGSLARREPSIIIENDIPKLYSDLDFVIITDNHIQANALIKWIKSSFPKYINTFQILNEENIEYVEGNFALDLKKGFEYPIYQHKEFKLHPKDKKNYNLESVVYQVCSYFLYPDKESEKDNRVFRLDKEYHRKKLLMECSRSVTPYVENPSLNNSYYNTYLSANSNLLDRNLLSRLIKSREYAQEVFVIKENEIIEIIYKCFLYHFNNILSKDKNDLLDLVIDYHNENNDKNISEEFSLLVALFVCLLHKEVDMKVYNAYRMLGIKNPPDNVISTIDLLKTKHISYFEYLANRNSGYNREEVK